jgi:hypothetical protein
MLKKISIGFLTIIVLFLAYAATKPSKFYYERNGLINATPEEIFPYISDLNLGGAWNPYEKRDPNMKKTITGNKMLFDGNKDVGAGSIEVLKVVPGDSVDLRLIMTRPMDADQMIHYRLKREGDATRFSWAMEGDGGFMMKVVGVFINCEEMITKDMNEGITNLKTLIESKK